MSADDTDVLRNELPEVFDDKPLPPGWDDDWLLIPAPSIEKALPPAFEEFRETLIPEAEEELRQAGSEGTWRLTASDMASAPYLPRIAGSFPGSPCYSWTQGTYPPPNTLAFYLPFYYYHRVFPPSWWGVNLTVEGFSELSRLIWRIASGKLTKADAMLASRVFLYGQKVYHHRVECFATRLEISHRVPLYKVGFAKFYQNDPRQTEDTLATVQRYEMPRRAFRREQSIQQTVVESLQAYIKEYLPPYKLAEVFFTPRGLKRRVLRGAEGDLAEANHREALPSFPNKGSKIWHTFPHAFSGISRITSRVNYIIHRDSPMYHRLGFHLRHPHP